MASRISIFEERSFGYVELFFGFTFGRLGEAVIAKSISGREAKGGALRVRNLVMQFFRATNSTK